GAVAGAHAQLDVVGAGVALPKPGRVAGVAARRGGGGGVGVVAVLEAVHVHDLVPDGAGGAEGGGEVAARGVGGEAADERVEIGGRVDGDDLGAGVGGAVLVVAVSDAEVDVG